MGWDISDVVNYGTVASWVIGTILYIGRLAKGEAMIPKWLSRVLASNVVLGIIITLGLGGSAVQAYLNYQGPRVVEKTVEKIAPRECPKIPVCPQPSKPPHELKNVSPLVIPPGATIQATTNAPDSAAVGVNTGTINVNADPLKPVVTWFLNGEQRISAPGHIVGALGESAAYERMLELSKGGQWSNLLNLCEAEIAKAPAWLTPYYYKGLAEANLQNLDGAIESMNYVESRATGNLDYGNLSDRAKDIRTKVEAYKIQVEPSPKYGLN
jgi:hypothetical protein